MSPLPASISRLQAAFERSSGAAMPVRQQAFTQFMQRGFPTTQDELWKYTQLRRLETREFVLGQPDATYSPVALQADAYQLLFVDGYYRAELSRLPASGIVIRSLAELQSSDPAMLASLLTSEAASPLVALNTALSQDGVLLEVAAEMQVDKPLFLSFAWSDQNQNLMAHPRVVIQAGRNSKLIVIEHYVGQPQSKAVHFTNAVTTLAMAEGSQLEHCRIQNETSSTFHIGLLQAELAKGAALTSHQINFGAVLGRMDITVHLQGSAASVSMNGLQFATGNQHLDTHTRVEHCVPHTVSREDYRGIADHRGRVVFNGKVLVREKAIKTDAQQSSRNLLLANTAEIDTKPELEIYNDDVKCAHGATVGQLDANALFYLRSRGLDAAQARALLTQAFAEHIVSQLPVTELRDQLTAASHARFGAQLEIVR
jgi:Fe-S cluster assembly protein SufD